MYTRDDETTRQFIDNPAASLSGYSQPRKWKELIVYQDCMWYISCEGMHVYMPRAIDASGWFSAGFPKKTKFGLHHCVICCVVETKLVMYRRRILNLVLSTELIS